MEKIRVVSALLQEDGLTHSDRAARLLRQHSRRLFTPLHTRDLLQQSAVHAGFLGVHHASQSVFPPLLNFGACLACEGGGRAGSLLHLVAEELLILENLLFALLLKLLTVLGFFFGALDPMEHVRLVGTLVLFLTQLLFAHLKAQLFVQPLVVVAQLLLVVNVL